jgi:sorbose reductase
MRKLNGPSSHAEWEALAGQEATTGTIVFTGSIASHISAAVQNISCYSASKAAVRGLVKPLSMELAPYGIRVNSLSPGYMIMDMMRGLQVKQPKLVKQLEKETLFGRIGFPEELNGAILFLCTQASGWYTGQDLLVDGGASFWKYPASFASLSSKFTLLELMKKEVR